MASLKFAISIPLVCVALAAACSSSPHEFTANAGGDTAAAAEGGSGAATHAGGMSTQGGSTQHMTGGKSQGTAGGSSMAGAGGESTPVAECELNAQQNCWELEDGTAIPGPDLDMGSCHVGTRSCTADLVWGPCSGAVGPKPADSCEVAGNDDDCNGKPNEGCACVTGTKRSCGTDMGSCKAGEQTCVDKAWGSCVGEIAAKALDSCVAEGNDDNCNGTANDACPCVGNASKACNDCGSRECNPEARQWGACHAAQDSTCSGPSTVRDCLPDGTFDTNSCQFACVQGQCSGSCVPNDTRCVTNPERRQSCNDQGVWTTSETCSGNKLCKDNGASCIAPCAGQKLCPGNVCAPLGGCCSDADCANDFACLNGTCSTDTCQAGFNGPCGGVCTKGCCSVNDCPDRANMGRTCSNAHQCTYQCKINWGNCDGNDGNGCEVNLINGTTSGTTVKHCGECGNTCNFHNLEGGGSDCDTLANSCQYTECWASFKNPGDPTDEYAYDCPEHRPHAALHRGDCSIGCLYDCEPGYSDCNGSDSDGCETNNADCEKNPFWAGVF